MNRHRFEENKTPVQLKQLFILPVVIVIFYVSGFPPIEERKKRK